jgi:proteasome assembly chaperone (PAC2) family protein
MGIIFREEPELDKPVMIASWPGIGNIGIIAVNYLIQNTEAREFAELEPWDFFDPRKVVIEGGLLKNLEFPSSKFYFHRAENQDLILFLGEQQPTETGTPFPRGTRPMEMAGLVMDVAQKFGCRRTYVPAAAVAPVHHSTRPRVWAVPNSEHLIGEVRGYDNTVLMSDVGQRGGQGAISGLNGLLLGLAAKRGLEAICVMGEIPFYVQGLPMAYPKASRSVLEVLVDVLGLPLDFTGLDKLVSQVEKAIANLETQFYQQTPPEMAERIREWIESFKQEPTEASGISDEEAKWLKDHVEDLFGMGGEGDERPH